MRLFFETEPITGHYQHGIVYHTSNFFSREFKKISRLFRRKLTIWAIYLRQIAGSRDFLPLSGSSALFIIDFNRDMWYNNHKQTQGGYFRDTLNRKLCVIGRAQHYNLQPLGTGNSAARRASDKSRNVRIYRKVCRLCRIPHRAWLCRCRK